MNTFLWWSGALAWLFLGFVGAIIVADWTMDTIVKNLWTKREFLAFVWDRMKARRAKKEGPRHAG